MDNRDSVWSVLVSRWLTIIGILLGLTGLSLAYGFLDAAYLQLHAFVSVRPIKNTWIEGVRETGSGLAGMGALAVALGALGDARRRMITWLERNDRNMAIGFGLLSAILLLPAILIGHSALFSGVRYWWLTDDAMISMRYARNLAAGHGLVWNPGEHVEGYTNFLWTGWMALIHLLQIPVSKTSLFVLFGNVALAVAAVPLCLRLVRLLGGGAFVAVATLCCLVFNRNVFFWTTAGLETVLLMVVFLLAVKQILEDVRNEAPRLTTYCLIGLLPLVRTDAIVLAGLLYAFAFLSHRSRGKVVFYGVLSLLPVIGHEVFRLYYYNDWMPNTARLKVTNWSGKTTAGVGYVREFCQHYAILLALMIFGAVKSSHFIRRSLTALIAVYAVYVAYVGGDVFGDFRFFLPVLPLVIILGFLGLEAILETLPHPKAGMASTAQSSRQTRRVALCTGLTVLAIVTSPLVLPRYEKYLRPLPSDVGNIQIALWIKAHTPPDARVADFWAGSIFYFSERYAIDFLGKCDSHIAKLQAKTGGTAPGHNKYDFFWTLGMLKPDFVVACFKLPVSEEEMRRKATGACAFEGGLYFDPVFREQYLPCPVTTDTWRTVFIRRDQVNKRETLPKIW